MRPVSITHQLVTADADGISLAQGVVAGDPVLINGALASGGIATLDAQRRVLLTSAINLSAVTLTIIGTNDQGAPLIESLLGPNAGTVSSLLDFRTVTSIVTDLLIGVRSVGVLTLTGDPVAAETVTIGTQVYTWVAAVSAADEILIGATEADSLDNLIAAINGAAGEGSLYGTGTVTNVDVTAADGVGDTMDVTAIAPGVAGDLIVTTETMTVGSFGGAVLGSGADGITVGTSGVGGSQVIPIDQYQAPTNIGLAATVVGTVNYTVQHTFDDIFAVPRIIPTWFDHPTLAASVVNLDGNLAAPPRAVRVVINSGTGEVTLKLIQAGAIG